MSQLQYDHMPTDCLEYLDAKSKNSTHRINYLTLLEMFNASQGRRTVDSDDHYTRMRYYYVSELLRADASLKSTNFASIEFKSSAPLFQCLQHRSVDVCLLEKMSHTFGWKYQQTLVAQIISLLTHQRLDFEVRTADDKPTRLMDVNRDQLIIRSNVEKMKRQCMPYIDELTETETVAHALIHFMDSINYYFYELYMCVIELLSYTNRLPAHMELWRSVLLFLMHKTTTKRNNRIGQIESDAWLCTQSEAGVVPAIAKYRFPFWTIVHEPLKSILGEYFLC